MGWRHGEEMEVDKRLERIYICISQQGIEKQAEEDLSSLRVRQRTSAVLHESIAERKRHTPAVWVKIAVSPCRTSQACGPENQRGLIALSFVLARQTGTDACPVCRRTDNVTLAARARNTARCSLELTLWVCN